ncbi:fungal-specific transcription factor domain-containing protein [Xylaria sp. CBS 124048]|nr:fungal-specific transcription factor domain-containing protein [Xylaria sp. CBS 124048]
MAGAGIVVSGPEAIPDPIPQADDVVDNRPKRVDTACKGCRERKVKCSGTMPCTACVRRHQECVFPMEDHKVSISRSRVPGSSPISRADSFHRYFEELKRKYTASDDCGTSPPKRIHLSLDSSDRELSPRTTETTTVSEPVSGPTLIDDDGPLDNDTGRDDDTSLRSAAIRNPLASKPSAFVVDLTGRRHFLGPTSTWSYSQQVMNLIKEYLKTTDSPDVPLNPEGRDFVLDWPSTCSIGPLSPSALPSLDYALYLMNTVKFHVGQLYHMFHEKTFLAGLYKYYEAPYTEPAPENRLWYIHFLLIMAFGHALLSGYIGQRPAGSELASRAIELMPDPFALNKNPVMSAEILCCLALYLQSIDHRNNAFLYIGQAMRMALSQGLHRELVGDTITDEETQRNHAVWWTIYILDRRFSSLMGTPNLVREDEITVPLPDLEQDSHFKKALNLQVVLARLHARVLSLVYGSDTHLGVNYLKNTREVLKSMADLASHLNETFGMRFDNGGPISRVAATLNLYYHQCIVLSTRPLLLCLLRRLLNKPVAPGQVYPKITGPIKALLRAAQDSAARSIRILMALESQHLLENFLPFDLESTFSSAFVLALMAALPSVPLEETNDVNASHYLLSRMIDAGNVIAKFRREDLERLINFLLLLRVEISQRDLSVTDEMTAMLDFNASAYGQAVPVQSGKIGPFNDLSPEQMLSLAGLLELDPSYDHGMGEQWLWT